MKKELKQDGGPFAQHEANSIAQAKAVREQARAGGLRFDVYLPPHLADWLLGIIERGGFLSPSEAVFVILGEHQELEPHVDLRRELLKRRIESAFDDKCPSMSAEEVFKRLRAKFEMPLPAPAVWKQLPNSDDTT